MIIVQLSGGLGNQLFQYAMGRSLAIRNKVELKLDLTFFENYEWHDYSLHPFLIQERIASDSEINQYKRQQSFILNKIKRRILRLQPILVHEKDLSYDESYKSIKNPAYLFGYWQSELYFQEYESVIREEFKIKIKPSLPNEQLLKSIKTTESVSLHIRRGNFVAVDFVNKIHGTCSMEYYEKSIKTIANLCKNPTFYVFSDDIDWAKENLDIKFPTVFVDKNDAKTDFEDLRLMQSCKHNIIANSTFSWWAAWLNPNKSKIIVSPKEWFADERRNAETKDLIPLNWLRI